MLVRLFLLSLRSEYTPEQRRKKLDKFAAKRGNRVWHKRVKYDVRKNFADSRMRIKGRFVRKEDEEMLKALFGMTLGDQTTETA